MSQRYQQLHTLHLFNQHTLRLHPECVIHHRVLRHDGRVADPRGFLRMNLLHEVVGDAIFNQTDVASNIRTFLPVDEVTTQGVVFIAQQDRVFDSPMGLRFDLAHTDSEITRNSATPAWKAVRLLRSMIVWI